MKKAQISSFPILRSQIPDDETIQVNRELDEAIENFDFERAAFLYHSHLKSKADNLVDETDHYRSEAVRYIDKKDELCEKKLSRNEELYEQRCEECTEKYRILFEELVQKQQEELLEVREEWNAARAEIRTHINTKAADMLQSAQTLARSKRFEEAIVARNKAFYMKECNNLPEFADVNRVYKVKFERLIKRHKRELDAHRKKYQSELTVIYNQLNHENRLAVNKCLIDKAKVNTMVMTTALDDNNYIDTNTKAVISMVSPRFPQKSKVFHAPFLDAGSISEAVDKVMTAARSPPKLPLRRGNHSITNIKHMNVYENNPGHSLRAGVTAAD